MSMPTFPENGINLTKEQAFHMLLGSIAMEELALSHIMNAEGEKLQYILGTLPDSKKCCYGPSEILEVNQSITNLLDAVAQNQVLLKGKLSQVLQAMEKHIPCQPSKCLCMLRSSRHAYWKKGCPLCWEPLYSNGDNTFCQKECQCQIQIPKNSCLLMQYSFQFESEECDDVSFEIKALKNNYWEELFLGQTSSIDSFSTISGSLMLSPQEAAYPILFSLKNPYKVLVKNAEVSFISL